jgi:IclR family acetate operon transcriptional repressor
MSQYTIRSAVKVLDALFAFDTTESLSLDQLGEQTQQSRNQTFRCVKTLQEYGLIAERDGRYVLTPMILRLVPSVRRHPVATIAEPYLRRLQEQTDETVNFVVRWQDRETITLTTLPSRHAVRLVSQIGQVSLLHAGATPKAILAFSPPKLQEQVLAELPTYPQYTPFTEMNPDKLRTELEATRQRRYAVSDQDFELGGRGIGAPVFDHRGEPIAGVSVGGPVSRVSDLTLRTWSPLLIQVAESISTELGWTGELLSAHAVSTK